MLSAVIPSSSPAPFLTQPPPLFPCSQVFLCRFHLKLLFLTWLTVWAKTIFISTILAGKTTVLLLEGTQNVPDVIFLYNFIVLNIIIVQSISPSLIFSDNIEENWSAQCSITQPSQQRGTPTHRECAKCQQNPGGHWGNHVLFADKNVTAGLWSLWKRKLEFTSTNGTFDVDFIQLGDLKHVF